MNSKSSAASTGCSGVSRCAGARATYCSIRTDPMTWCSFDPDALAPIAERIGPTPAELGQSGEGLDRWAELRAAGRPWLTGVEATPVPVGG